MRQLLTLHILSDSVGETAGTIARVIETQYLDFEFEFVYTTMIDTERMLRDTVTPYIGDARHIFVFTFTSLDLLAIMQDLVRQGAYAIDVLADAMRVMRSVTHREPAGTVGMLHQIDNAYFQRIAAMEYSVNHDDGQLPDSLIEADIVLIGVSRTSKTPLSMYLAHRGFKTANIPLAIESPPPVQLFEIDPRRVFGLVTSPELLMTIRTERMDEMGMLVPQYATREYVERELSYARETMKRIGCIILNTENRAIESLAQEIRHYMHYL
ncbi:MAG: kinase/pyrophosphorylase [Actinomycetes bacterium]|nr:kinase/pyrophosphorylase [Actinomycetes bacterium]